jgi:hypothetical protein
MNDRGFWARRAALLLTVSFFFTLAWLGNLREASAFCGWGCTSDRQCDMHCTPLPNTTCQQKVAAFDGQGGFFWNAIGHCNRDGILPNRDAVIACAWDETVKNSPQFSNDACVKKGLVDSASSKRAIDMVVAQLVARNNPPPGSCGAPLSCTSDRYCKLGCPPMPGQSCAQHVRAFDGAGGWFWNAVHHCTRPGVPATRDGVIACAWDEVIQNSPHFRGPDEACIKKGLTESPSGKMAIDEIVAHNAARDNAPAGPCYLGCTSDRYCDLKCTPLPNQTCQNHVRAFDGRGGRFWNSAMHCNRAGVIATRDAVTECAWADTVANSPSFANDTCIKNGLVNSPSGKEAIDMVTSQLASSTQLHTATDAELATCRAKTVHSGGPTACKSYADWRAEATQSCGKQGLTAIEFTLGDKCPGDAMFRGVHYACCSKVPKDQNTCSDSELLQTLAEAQFNPDKVQEGLLNFFVTPATAAVGYTAPELIRLVKEIVATIKHGTCFNRIMGEQSQELGFMMDSKAAIFSARWEGDPCGSATTFWSDALEVLRTRSMIFQRLPLPLRAAAYSTMAATTPLVCGTSYAVFKLKQLAQKLMDEQVFPWVLAQATDMLLNQDTIERMNALADKRLGSAEVGPKYADDVMAISLAMSTKNRPAYDQAVAKLRSDAAGWYRVTDAGSVDLLMDLLLDLREPLLSQLAPAAESAIASVLDPIYQSGRDAGVAGFGEVPYVGGVLAGTISFLSDLAHMALKKAIVYGLKTGIKQLLGLGIEELRKALKGMPRGDVTKFVNFMNRLMPTLQQMKTRLGGLNGAMQTRVDSTIGNFDKTWALLR